MASLGSVRDSVKQITEFSWLIGRIKILRFVKEQHKSSLRILWENEDGSHYMLDDAPAVLPHAETIHTNGHVRQIHDAGDSSAVFEFGNSLILKVKIARAEGSKEHETLAFLSRQQLNFDVPAVLFHADDTNRSYLFEPRMPGRTLNDVWWDLCAIKKQRVAGSVAKICRELAAFKSDNITMTDLNWIDPLHEQYCDTPEALQKHCESLGMDCSMYILSHNDLGPSNILIDDQDRLTVIDWDLAGYCPLHWVRTKFAVCGALDVERSGKLDAEYRTLVGRQLGHIGFPEVTEAYKKLEKERSEEWIKKRPWLQ